MLPPLPAASTNPLTPLPAARPFNTTTGWLPFEAKSGSVLASSTNVSVMAGSALVTSMVCAPPTKASVMLKPMLSRPTVLLAAIMASRNDTLPSAPLLALSCSAVKLLPKPVSFVSAVVVTTSVLDTSSTVMVKACVSVRKPSLTCTVTP